MVLLDSMSPDELSLEDLFERKDTFEASSAEDAATADRRDDQPDDCDSELPAGHAPAGPPYASHACSRRRLANHAMTPTTPMAPTTPAPPTISMGSPS